MATTTVPRTKRAPRIAVGFALQRARRDPASIADVAAALNVLAAVIGDEDDVPPLDVADAQVGEIVALAVVEHEGAPLIVSGGGSGSLRSWRLDGTPGELQVSDAHTSGILALVVVEHEGAPLIISAGWTRPSAWVRVPGRKVARVGSAPARGVAGRVVLKPIVHGRSER